MVVDLFNIIFAKSLPQLVDSQYAKPGILQVSD